MSRRKQSRPQHVENGEKKMPGTDFTIEEDKLVGTSPNPEIEFEEKGEKPTNLDMTQSAMLNGERALESVPSTNGTGIATQADKIAALNAAKKNTQRSGSPDTNESNTTPSLTVRRNLENNKVSIADGSVTSFSPTEDLYYAKIKLEVAEIATESSTPKSEKRADKNVAKMDDEKKIQQDKNLMKAPYQQLPPAVYDTMALERRPTHECMKCGVSFRGRENYEVHVKHYCCGQRYGIDCRICGAKFDSNRRLKMHMDVHVPQNVCLLCSKRMAESDCEQHVLFHMESIQEKDGIIQCPSCDLPFKENRGLLRHIRIHHIINESITPFLGSHPLRTVPKESSSISSVSGKNAKVGEEDNAYGSEASSGINKSHSAHFDDAIARDISPPMKASTPSRSSSVKETEKTAVGAFSCIVCGFGFPDVITLQRHLLTTHTAASNRDRETSPARKLNNEKTLQTKITRPNLRKVSTVSPPQLSLLATTSARKNSEPCHSKTTMDPPKTGSTEANCHRARNSVSALYSKKRRNKIGDNDQKNDFVPIQQNSLKRAKRDSECISPKEKDMISSDRLTSETRRVSCPVVSNKISGTEQFEISGSSFQKQHDTDRYCVQCDIKFSSAGNFRAHKQFYCASRHIQKIREGFQKDLCDDREDQNDSSNESEGYNKSRKRNVGNRSSMTPRKRSHLIPLETAGGSSSPLYEGTAAAKPTSVRKSCPSQFGGVDASSRASPSDDPSPTAIPKLPQKHLCQECNIWFSKYDTYIAHKKYYCESRRKDRIGERSVQTLTRNHTKRRSESSLRETISQSDSTRFVPERSEWSSRGSSPLTEAEDERQTKKKDTECPVNLQTSATSYIPQFPLYGQADAEILARLSFMQPLLLNQYIAMLRERVTQGMQSNGVLFPTPPFGDLLSMGSDLSINRTRKLSADETRLSGVMGRDGSTSPLVRRNNRPSRQSCVAVINVKQENRKSDEEHSKTMSANSAPLRNGASPLDLSTKLSAESTEAKKPPMSLYPTIDLSTTALPIVKQEPQPDFPTRNSCHGATTGMNDNNVDVNRASPVVTISVNSQQDNQAPQVKHCKNCDARFTSLSTFIAHKKYYCAGASSGGLVRNDVKPAQLAH